MPFGRDVLHRSPTRALALHLTRVPYTTNGALANVARFRRQRQRHPRPSAWPRGALLGSILDPKAYGFRSSLAELNVGLTKDMEEYAVYMQTAIEAAMTVLEIASRIAKAVFPKEAPGNDDNA